MCIYLNGFVSLSEHFKMSFVYTLYYYDTALPHCVCATLKVLNDNNSYNDDEDAAAAAADAADAIEIVEVQ